jgi:hypothetical protein
MTQTPGPKLESVDQLAGPRTLILHDLPVTVPGGTTAGSHPHGDSLSFLEEIIGSASGMEGVREISLAVHRSSSLDHGKTFLTRLGGVAVQNGLNVSAVSSFDNVMAWGLEALSMCQQVGLVVDAVRFPSLRLPREFFALATHLQAEGCAVGLHVMLSKAMLDGLTLPRLRRWLAQADVVHLLVPRGGEVDFTRAQLAHFFQRIAPLWEKPDRFFHLQVDRCIKPQFFPWNQLEQTCPGTDDALNLRPDGGLSFCAVDLPFTFLADPGDLANTVSEHFHQNAALHRSTCPNIRFAPA